MSKETSTMVNMHFNAQDLEQIRSRGLTPETIAEQINTFKKGFPHAGLLRPCTVGDGIRVLTGSDLQSLMDIYSKPCLAGRAMKFVPASGAATRMCKSLLAVYSCFCDFQQGDLSLPLDSGDPDEKGCARFIQALKEFAFYDDLKRAMARDGLDTEALLSKSRYQEIMGYILTAKGLNLAETPKGLVKFHVYPHGARTALEEHLVEGVAYTKDMHGRVHVHFTVSPEHESDIREHLENAKARYEKGGTSFDVQFSIQKPSTDTLAVDMANEPFRESDGKLLFRPSGHGALLENISALNGDIVFIKNIDNVVPDRLKGETVTYKRALGGYLAALQDQIFSYLKRLQNGEDGKPFLKEVMEFSRDQLSIVPMGNPGNLSKQAAVQFLTSTLNRPLRVCGMVKNAGEPGGGPFWVEDRERGPSLQIVESSQVDMESKEQRAIWESATHFNPVDLVCGVRDVHGKPFDLMRFRDPNTGFISIKSKEGRDLKALELPGLWNGAMAHWITVFVEVPATTFAPVKTILDLLRKEHQPWPGVMEAHDTPS